MNRLAPAPVTASVSRTTPIRYSRSRKKSESMPPLTVPRITARNESDSSTPLPRESMFGCKISGIMPYFAGTKKALCSPIRNTVERTIHGPYADWRAPPPNQNPITATNVMPISANFQKMSELVLL